MMSSSPTLLAINHHLATSTGGKMNYNFSLHLRKHLQNIINLMNTNHTSSSSCGMQSRLGRTFYNCVSISPLSLVPSSTSHYELRKHLQKIEFCTCWAILIAVATTYLDKNAPFLLSPSTPLLYYSTLYLKASVVSRALAYCSDFTNASEKCNGDLPVWLVLHHFGGLLQHFSKAMFLLGDPTSCRSQVILFALASQSSHNTWTKKHSMVLYWGNVLVGSLACCAIHLSHGGMSSDVQGAAMTFLLGLVVTSVGIVLLVAGSMYQRHFFLTMKQEKAKSTSSKR
jgi:hypothetical protein